jgi:uncharacterized Zn finger protein
MHPRKVRGGVRLSSKSGPVSQAWAGQRWFRLVEEHAPNEALVEGLEYARAGQTRMLRIGGAEPAPGDVALPPGHVHARVQGRMPTAYTLDLRLPVFSFEQWERVLDHLAGEARQMAGLLSGEVPPNIEDAFAPAGLRLFPQEPSDLAIACSCRQHAERRGAVPWCKHACCVMALLAERLGRDPFLIFAMRGLPREDLLERLRQRRALAAARASIAGTERPLAGFMPRLPGVNDQPEIPLEQTLDRFWCSDQSLETLDLSLREPEVSHPLLRRLGPSPFTGSRFPFLGLLATCYDIIGTRARSVVSAPQPEGGITPADSPDGPA